MGSSESENEEGTSSNVFIVTFLIIALITLLVLILKRVFYKFEYDNAKYQNCTCSKCKSRVVYQKGILRRKNINKYLWLYIALFIVVLYNVYICCCEISYSTPSLKFDPYTLLNVTESSTSSQIKQSYKKLARQYHPDKNKEEDAKEKFMLISKAYKALSTEEGKRNFAKYGDPDGPNYYRLDITLPSFMMNKNISQIVIGIFIAFVIIILPVSFLKWFSNSKKYNENGMMTINQSIFYNYLNDNTVQTEIPFILGLAFEMNTLINDSSREHNTIDDSYANYIQYMPKHDSKKIPSTNKKAICILYSYFFRSPLVIDYYEKDLNKILSFCPFLLKYMIEMCFECSLVAPIANSQVKLFQNTIKTLIYFTQNLYQQGDLTSLCMESNSLLQLPHFNQTIINSHSYFKSMKSMNVLIKLSRKEKEKYLNKDSIFTEEQLEDIIIALDSIPQYDIKLDSKIESYGLNNSITLKGDINILNINKDKLLGLRHSVSFSESFTDELMVLITHDGKLIDCKIFSVNTVSSSFKFVMLTADGGTLNYSVEIFSLNYKGIDQMIPVSFESTLSKKNMNQNVKHLSQSKINYFDEMFKQRIPYVEYNSEEDDEDYNNNNTDLNENRKPKTE